MIELPVSARTSPAGRSDGGVPLTAIESKRVLVVDDEPDVADVLREILEQAGHYVDVAGEGAAALELLAQGLYDLVLTDTKMPGLDGPSFYREVEQRFPVLTGHVIFLTGDLVSQDNRQFLESAGAPCLAKPFDIQEVRRLVQQMLSPVDER